MAADAFFSHVDVDATLEALQHTLGHFNVVDEEEPKILKG